MSYKIKIDLSEMFGVKEGQEFRFVGYRQKYKIENGILYSYSDYTLDWFKTNFTLSNIKTEFEIEILKPETPPEIKKMLQAFYDMGFRIFYYESGSLCFDGGGKPQSFWINDELDKWVFSLIQSIKPNKICEIKDYI